MKQHKPRFFSFQVFINVDENLTSMDVQNIKTVFDNTIAEKGREEDDDNDETDTIIVPSYATALEALDSEILIKKILM